MLTANEVARHILMFVCINTWWMSKYTPMLFGPIIEKFILITAVASSIFIIIWLIMGLADNWETKI